MNYLDIENKLYTLQHACRMYANTDPLAMWVLYALERHIMTDRATIAFTRAFVRFPDMEFESMIRKCLNGDRSHDGIIKTCKRIFTKYM